jgi:hypothetical protein
VSSSDARRSAAARPGTGDDTGAAGSVLDDIPRVLGVPNLNLIFQRLASWPDYLSEVWRRSRPLLGMEQFDEAADALHDLAAQGPRITISPPCGLAQGDLDRATRLTAMYAHVQPRLLLLMAGWTAGLEDRPLPPASPPPAGCRGVAERASGFGKADDVPMIELPPADPAVAQTLERMIDRRNHPGVASYYRSLAQWPTLLVACWQALEPVVVAPEYSIRARDLAAAATTLATSLRLHEAAAVVTHDAPVLLPLLRSWRDIQVPHLMLDTCHIQQGLQPT